MTDSIDGGELGAGRRLVEYLIQNSCKNIVVYVVRYHRGPNLGPVRFDMIVNAAKSVIDEMPNDLGASINMINNQVSAFFLHRRIRGGRSDLARSGSGRP